MKPTLLLGLLCVGGTFAASLGTNRQIQKRQDGMAGLAGILGGMLTTGSLAGPGGKVKDPPGAAPKRVVLQGDSKIPGVKRIKIRSGPYSVPNMNKKSQTGHLGMLESYYDNVIEKPCSGNCNILRQVGGLEYADGSNANIDSGMWLHHMVHFVSSPRRWDPVALGGGLCLPFFGNLLASPKQSASNSERYFVTGNERSVVNYHQTHQTSADMTSGTAFHLEPADKFTYLVELMNMNMEDKTVYITMTYDILDGPLPTGWMETKTIYLDAASCGTSEVAPPVNMMQYVIPAKPRPWRPNLEGKIIFAMGHLHDGGVEIDVKASPSSSLCKSPAQYSENPQYVWRGKAMGPDKVAQNHISSMPGCDPKDLKVPMMKKDQSWTVAGSYDYSKHEGNLESGKQADVMAIAILLVAVPPNLRRPA